MRMRSGMGSVAGVGLNAKKHSSPAFLSYFI
jgi:hypothetical protein